MTITEYICCPFERRIIGSQGAFLLRFNRLHADHAVEAIRRRTQPAWSRFADEIRIAA